VSVSTTARRAAWLYGHRAERWAAFWLRLKGYRILARRLKTPVGEIDLVARRGTTLVAIEVKARDAVDNVASMADLVRPHQRKRIEKALLLSLDREPNWQSLDIRFDVVLVSGPLRLTHIKDAWRPGDRRR